jgi:hypothetical protein
MELRPSPWTVCIEVDYDEVNSWIERRIERHFGGMVKGVAVGYLDMRVPDELGAQASGLVPELLM